MYRLILHSLAIPISLGLPIVHALPLQDGSSGCKCTITDSCWPSPTEWSSLNSTVGGRLITTVPLGSPCHGDTFNETTCDNLKSEWNYPLIYETTTSGIMNPWWQNGSCDPFHSSDSPCLKGNEPVYTIEAASAQDVQAGLKFASKNNIRITIHNTGHDFMGRSSGASSLAIATVNLNSTDFYPSYSSSHYSGPAIKVGAGLRGYEVYSFAHSLGYRVVGGDCPTVGLAGGYIQGGGHGSLGSLYGMAADQVLEWEVVLPDGTLLTVTPDQHGDLYWALTGGGGGNYAVVISVTIRTYQDIGPISGARLTISNSSSLSSSVFWSIVSDYHAALPTLYSSGGGSEEHDIGANQLFAISRITAPKWTPQQLRQWLSPITRQLDSQNATYSLNVTAHSTFYDHYVYYQGPIPAGRYKTGILAHSRLVPLDVVTSPTKNSALTQFFRSSTENPSTANFIYGCIGMNASAQAPVADNAVLPAWRHAALSCIVFTPFPFTASNDSVKENLLDTLMNDLAPKFKSVTPNSGTYANEGNWALKSWKEDYYGKNWERLSLIKNQVDPNGLLYGIKNVGSEKWTLHDDGRLCSKH